MLKSIQPSGDMKKKEETEVSEQNQMKKFGEDAGLTEDFVTQHYNVFSFFIPEVSLNNVIGMKRTKAILRKYIDLPIKNPRYFEDMDISKSVGIIVYGPPGVGKTLICQAIASELDINFCEVEPSKIISKFQGMSAKLIKLVFMKARLNEPTILFFDECDTLLQSRDRVKSDGETELKEAISQMLIETDKVIKDKKLMTFMIGATNQPWNIDIAQKRSGRFEYELYIKAPDFSARRKLFKLYLRNNKKDEYIGNINYSMLALATMDYSPADIQKICKIAILNVAEHKKKILTTYAVQKALHSKEGGKSSLDSWYITMYHTYLPQKKSFLKWLISKKYRQQEPEKRKFNEADLKLYTPLIKDVNRHFRWLLFIRIFRELGRGWAM